MHQLRLPVSQQGLELLLELRMVEAVQIELLRAAEAPEHGTAAIEQLKAMAVITGAAEHAHLSVGWSRLQHPIEAEARTTEVETGARLLMADEEHPQG